MAKDNYKGLASEYSVYKSYKRNAKSRGIAFEISREFFKAISAMDCHYCGVKPYRSHSEKTKDKLRYNPPFTYNGIDRKDNSIGYLEYNCLPACTICNVAKKDLPYDEFLLYIKRLITHNLN